MCVCTVEHTANTGHMYREQLCHVIGQVLDVMRRVSGQGHCAHRPEPSRRGLGPYQQRNRSGSVLAQSEAKECHCVAAPWESCHPSTPPPAPQLQTSVILFLLCSARNGTQSLTRVRQVHALWLRDFLVPVFNFSKFLGEVKGHKVLVIPSQLGDTHCHGPTSCEAAARKTEVFLIGPIWQPLFSIHLSQVPVRSLQTGCGALETIWTISIPRQLTPW